MQLESRAAVGTVSPMVAGPSPRDMLWDHCRNNLGIARLLVHEGRPESLVATACWMAVESACRAVLDIDRLDRRLCRLRAEQSFSAEAVVPLYESLYASLLNGR